MIDFKLQVLLLRSGTYLANRLRSSCQRATTYLG